MHFLVLILGIVLLPKVHTLRCFTCGLSNTTCDNTEITCSSGSQCNAVRISQIAGGLQASTTNKGCQVSEGSLPCGENSVNFGISRTIINNDCCDTNLCNGQPPSVPTQLQPNGKRCFFCNGQTCRATLDCIGNEDHCISALATIGPMTKGCASRLMCAGLVSVTQNIGLNITCCQGDFCNGASTASAGLLLLVAPLVSLVMCAVS